MPDARLEWPFLDPRHRSLAQRAVDWAARTLPDDEPADVDGHCRELVRLLAAGGWLAHCVADPQDPRLDVRALCLMRDVLAHRHALADFAFAMQGLGSTPIALGGSAALREAYLPPTRAGERIAAFALTEPGAGSDVAAIATTARRDGADYVLDGEKTFISNAGIADYYVVFARTGEAPGARGLSAFVVDADAPGLEVCERIDVIAPHPLGRLRFSGCRVPAQRLLGEPGGGFRVAMATLDRFRPSVGAAALGMARRALEETLRRVRERRLFGGRLADLQLTQGRLADMALAVESSALMVYRAAWVADTQPRRATREASMAKLAATEAAQQVIDGAVQLHGGLGVTAGSVVERLYREVRALRIYEGASEVHRLIIARELLRAEQSGDNDEQGR